MRAARLAAPVLVAAIMAACSPAPEEDAMDTLPSIDEVVAVEAPYDPQADAHGALDAAFEAAAANRTRVLVKFGGNWCPDCRIMAGMLEIPVIAGFLEAQYEYVAIDVGRYDNNMDVVARFGLEELEGVPTIIIATADGEIINAGTAAEWRTARERDPQDVLDYLRRYAASPVPERATRAETRRPEPDQ